MLTREQERSLRSICKNTGKRTLSTPRGLIQVAVEARPGTAGKRDATITYPNGGWSRLNDWAASDLYIEIAERLDDQYEVLSDADDAPEGDR